MINLENKTTVKEMLQKVYPVGSIYMSVNNTSPATLFGGTWEQVQDRFLLAAGTTYTAGATGGAATHTLTNDELPALSGSFGNISIGNDQFESGIISGSTSGSAYGPSSSKNVDPKHDTLTISFGKGRAHNNMPPYLTVYVWKRTA